MELRALIGAWTVPTTGAPLEAGHALVKTLGRAGAEAEVLEEAREVAGVTLVHVPAENAVVLVHHPDDPPIRSVVRQYQLAILEPHRPFLAAAERPPPDVAWLFSERVAAAEGALRFLSLDAPLAIAGDAVDQVRPPLEVLAGRPLDPATGLHLFEALDALVMSLRCVDPDDEPHPDAVYPLYTLVSAGFLAIAAARGLVGEVELGGISREGEWFEAERLVEVNGLPAIRVPGQGAMQLTRKLVHRWFAGEIESCRDLWEAWDAMRPESPPLQE